MSSFKDPNIMREIIMDYYTNPRNKREENGPDYFSIHQESESCIDDIYVYAKISNGMVEDVSFTGVACAIATSSTSIMTELLKGKSIAEAKALITNYNNMIFEKDYDEDSLQEAIAFQNVHKQANRIKCATIGWNGMTKLIEQYEKKEN